MSISRTVNISCPTCGTQQDVELYDAVNVETNPRLKDALMHNQLNRVECIDCDACVEACPVDACFAEDQLPEEWASFTEKNAQYFQN